MKHKRNILYIIILTFLFICGWGASGHKVINRRATFSFPPSMSSLIWADSLAAHASDADIRRNTDSNEAPRHFIDIDDYPEFVANGRIPQDLDSLIALHGSAFVYNVGILPFSIMATVDSVKRYFQLHNFSKAMLKAADLGHYVGDGHQPLHITRNYDGQFTNQSGVHSRYETQMINRDTGLIVYNFENAVYVSNINQFVFNFIYSNYKYVDSVLKYDSIAHAMTGGYSTNYYQMYWQLSGNFTAKLFNNASHFIASLIYTAWINAGGPAYVIASGSSVPDKYRLEQNFPNPFNPATTIKFGVPDTGPHNKDGALVRLVVYDISGKEIATVVNERLLPGSYEAVWNASNFPSGTYFYRLSSDEFSVSKRMILIK